MSLNVVVDTEGPIMESFLTAEAESFVGIFRVSLHQISPHPLQRALVPHWAESLHKRFVDVGIDRTAHPIKVILASPEDFAVAAHAMQPSHLAWLPKPVKVLVYHGQHRVAACEMMEKDDEHWWCANVYRSTLADKFPAEFVTLMHMGNEEEHRLVPSDADRFLALHHLSILSHKGSITAEACQANQARILRSVLNETTRRGLSNLVCSDELADAIAEALKHTYIRGTFNAGTWGKKLVKGRFFKLAACLVDEMVEQCRLLLDDKSNVSVKTLTLPASACTWTSLEKAVKKRGHIWSGLPGGALVALGRVKSRNPEFTTFLNPSGLDDWTFSHTALLPLVMTSDLVFLALKDMYVIAQHVINVAAGKVHLEKYTSNSQHSDDDDHPYGILSWVLRDKFAGKASNFPHKIIYTMWQGRQELSKHLLTNSIPGPEEATSAHYVKLIQASQPWWELLRMFKISPLLGQNIVVPKTFAGLDAAKKQGLLEGMAKKRLLVDAHDNILESGSKSGRTDQARARSSSLEFEPDEDASDGDARSLNTSSRTLRAKRSRLDEDIVMAELSVVPSPAPFQDATRHSEAPDILPSITGLSVPADLPTDLIDDSNQDLRKVRQQLKQQLYTLSTRVDELPLAEATQLQFLMQHVLDVQGQPYAARVMGTVGERLEGYAERAKEAHKSASCAEQEWRDGEE